MQGTAGPSREAGTVEEDAGAGDDLGARARRVGEHVVVVDGVVELPERWVEGGGVGGHGHRVLGAVEVGSDRTASLLQLRRWLVEDPEAAATPDARPVRLQERSLEPPLDTAGGNHDEFAGL